MKIAYKALWLIESRMKEPLSLDGVASELGVSDFHLARAFSATVGMPLMQYVRRRRLTEAARQLMDTDNRVLDIALNAGYGSQEAFARAFAAEFGTPPKAFRQQQERSTTNYLEAAQMESVKGTLLQAPRIEALPALRLVGLACRYNSTTSSKIPEQWSKFNELGLYRDAAATYGVCYNSDSEGNMDYLCGQEVTAFDSAAANLDRLTLPAQTYAVFQHSGHVSEIRDVWSAIWDHGLVGAGVVVSEGGEFEKYGPEFDSETGDGGFEIWIPIKET